MLPGITETPEDAARQCRLGNTTAEVTIEMTEAGSSLAPALDRAGGSDESRGRSRMAGVRATQTTQEGGLVFGVRELGSGDALKPSAMIMTPWLFRRAAVERVAGSAA